MPAVTKDALEQARVTLYNQRAEVLANLNKVQGAIETVEAQLASWDVVEKKKK